METEDLEKNTNQSILVFLPGLNEIFTFIDRMDERFGEGMEQFEIIPLHSTLSD